MSKEVYKKIMTINVLNKHYRNKGKGKERRRKGEREGGREGGREKGKALVRWY